MSTHHSGSGLNTMDFAGQVLPPPAVDFAGQVLPPPAVDFTMQALTSSSTMPSPASTLSATVKKEWDFTGQVLPHEQPHLVRKTESLSVGSWTRAEKVPERADVTRRNAELVAYISLHCTVPVACMSSIGKCLAVMCMVIALVQYLMYFIGDCMVHRSIEWDKHL